MGIKPETVARVQRFAFAVIRNNDGRAIPEELETNAFSRSVVRNALNILEERGLVARVPIPYRRIDGTFKIRRAWRIVGEPFNPKGAFCESMKPKETRKRACAEFTPTETVVLETLKRLNAVDSQSGLPAFDVSNAILGRKAAHIYHALRQLVLKRRIDYVTRLIVCKYGVGTRVRKTKLYFL